MKKYLADILTLIRLITAIVLFVFAIIGANPEVGFLLFVIGELTDAFDGACATKWPFPKGKTPKYRKYAVKYDIFADVFLCISMMLFFVNQVNTPAGLIMGISFAVFALIIEFMVYGKLFGHPDDFSKHSLSGRNFTLAKQIVLIRRRLYILLIAIVTVWTLYASTWDTVVKITITIILIAASIFFWFFLSQRRHNISRNAVDIEKKLSK